MKLRNLLTFLIAISLTFSNSLQGQITTSEVTVEETNAVTTISGDLGVGISNPQAKLDVNGYSMIFDRTSGHGILGLNTADNNKYAYINFGPGTGYGFQIGKDISNGGVAGANNFYIYDFRNSTPRFVIDDLSGNTGIGTTTPIGKLHISNTQGGFTPSNYLVVEGTTVDNNNYPGVQLKGGTLISNDQYPFITSTNGGLALVLSGGHHNTYNQRMSIDLSSNSAGSSKITWNRNGSALMHLDGNSGNLGIGTTSPTEKLHVNGKIRATGQVGWADFVFEDDYSLPELENVEKEIQKIGHLPGIPSAEEVRENGIDLTEMDSKLLQKIEELTLYLIEQDKEIKNLKRELKELKSKE